MKQIATISPVRTIHDIRRDNLLELRAKWEGPDYEYAEECLDISASFFGQLKKGNREIGGAVARDFEVKLGKPTGWLDQSIHLTNIEREFLEVLRTLNKEQAQQLSAYGGGMLATKQSSGNSE